MKCFLSLALLWTFAFTALGVPPGEGRGVKEFTLQNTDGNPVSLRNYRNQKGLVVVFTCIHCPFAKLYHQRLIALHRKYAPKKVPLLLINPSDTLMFKVESLKNMAQVVKEQQYPFPYLFDPAQQVAADFKAEKTPQAYVLWRTNDQWTIQYSGAIDDNGAHPEQVKQAFVAEAVDRLLKGKPVAVTEGYAIGCAIHYRKPGKKD